MPDADAEIIEKLRDGILGDRELIEGAIEDVIAELYPAPEAADSQREALERELHELARRQANLIDAIATAGNVPALAARLKEQEARRAHLMRALAALDDRAKGARVDPRRIERELVRRLTDLRRLLGEHTPIARQVVLKLLKDGRIIFTPKPEAGVYEYSGLSAMDELLAGVIPQEHAVPQVWRALQD